MSALANPDDASSVYALSPGFAKMRPCSRAGGGRDATTRTAASDCADCTIRKSAIVMTESDALPATWRVCVA